MDTIRYQDILTEAGIEVSRPDFFALSEEARIQVTDDVLTGLMKFITDKYNALDFGEIEKSAGDIAKFKYTGMINENVGTLRKIYYNSSDPGAKKYVDVCDNIEVVMTHLANNRQAYTALYQSGNGVIQLVYTSLVAACLYSIGVLVSNTIRFVTTEQNTDCEVLFDEIPGTIKHVHIKNINAAAGDIRSYEKLLSTYAQAGVNRVMSESISLSTVIAATIGIGVVISLIPKIIVLVREVIYSVYYSRVKLADMLDVQADLINTNIESLEGGRGNKKVIARQRRIAQKLEKWKNRVAIRLDTANSLVSMQKKRENTTLKVDRNSPIVREPGALSAGELML